MAERKVAETQEARPSRSRDDTKRKQWEEALRAPEATHRAIFDAVNEDILVLDMETGEIVDANATFCNVLGYTPEEVRALLVKDVSSGEGPYTHEDALRWIHRAATGESQRFEWRAKSKDGSLFWIDVTLKRATIVGPDLPTGSGACYTASNRPACRQAAQPHDGECQKPLTLPSATGSW